MFNDQSLVQIGGKWNSKLNAVERPFIGVMAGVLFNGLRPLDQLAAKNRHATAVGEVKVLPGGIPFNYKDQHPEYFTEEAMKSMMEKAALQYPATTNAQTPGANGKSCSSHRSQEDKIKCSFLSGDLVAHTSRANGGDLYGTAGFINCDDEEDCVVGSGSGDGPLDVGGGGGGFTGGDSRDGVRDENDLFYSGGTDSK